MATTKTSSSTTTEIFTALSRDAPTTDGATCDLIEETERLVRMSVAAVRGPSAHKFVEEHNAIISALQARDSRRAVSLLKAHVSAAVKRFSTALEWTAMQA